MDEVSQEASLAMDCIGWLTYHGYTLSLHRDGLAIQPENVPGEILERLVACGRGLDLLFPEFSAGRVLGGTREPLMDEEAN